MTDPHPRSAVARGYALSHPGHTIPPQADGGWIAAAWSGPTYGDDGRDGPVGFDNDFTARDTAIMTWNPMPMAKLPKGDLSNHGNYRRVWQGEGCDPSPPNPEHRV